MIKKNLLLVERELELAINLALNFCKRFVFVVFSAQVTNLSHEVCLGVYRTLVKELICLKLGFTWALFTLWVLISKT